LLKDKTGLVRDAAALALGKIGPEAKTAVPVLTELLKDEWVRKTAALALGEIGLEARTAVPALTELLKKEWVRQTAASALGNIGPEAKTAIPALTELLQDPDKDLHKTVAEALQEIKEEKK
jgi:HEAT repeat protein